ncbi:MAG: LOG family protein [candidate division NC10 bacterium]
MWQGRRVVTIFGSSRPVPGSSAYARAKKLGLGVARHGWVLCNGGYGGTMAAAAMGARRGGGETIGITCALYNGPPPNPYVTHHEEAPDLLARLGRLVDLGDAYVILPGGSGTLLEFALVLEFLHKRLMPPKPVLLFGNYWRPIVATVQREHSGSETEVQVVRTSEAVLQALVGAWGA